MSMHARLAAGLGLLTFLLSASASGQPVATDLQSALLRVFRDGVVKVEVSTNTPVFQEGRNICVSEGTGFLISSSYAVTAEHVYNMPQGCGERIILLKSRRHNVQVRATVADALNDTALLRIHGTLPDTMCALRVIATDVYDAPAFRFGIPGGIQDPSPEDVRIQDRNVDFAPLAVIRPAIAEPGESGGPVMFMFNVTGIIRARHPIYRAYSFMTPASNIRELMSRHAVRVEGPVCNPVDQLAFATDSVNAASRVRINAPVDDRTRQEVLASAAGLVQRNLGAGASPTVSMASDSLEIRTQERPQTGSESSVPRFDRFRSDEDDRFGLSSIPRISPDVNRFSDAHRFSRDAQLQLRLENTARVQQLSSFAASAIEAELWRRLVEETERRRSSGK